MDGCKGEQGMLDKMDDLEKLLVADKAFDELFMGTFGWITLLVPEG